MSPDRTAASPDVAQIEADIARHRTDLGETVDELAGRMDVKAQAKASLTSVRDRATHQVSDTTYRVRAAVTDPSHRTPAVVAPALAGVSAVLLLAGALRRKKQ